MGKENVYKVKGMRVIKRWISKRMKGFVTFFSYYLQAWMGRIGVIFSSFYFVSSQGDIDDIKIFYVSTNIFNVVHLYFDVEKKNERTRDLSKIKNMSINSSFSLNKFQ